MTKASALRVAPRIEETKPKTSQGFGLVVDVTDSILDRIIVDDSGVDIPVLDSVVTRKPASFDTSKQDKESVGMAPDPILLEEICEAVTDRARRLTSCLLEQHMREMEMKIANAVSDRLTSELPDIVDSAVKRYVARHKG